MKKYLLILIALLFLAFPLHADVNTKDGSAITTISDMDGSSDSHDVVDGQVIISPCPSFYADANVTFSWDGDYAADHNAACDSGGTKIDDSADAIDTHTNYGESGSVGANMLADNYLSWADSGEQYIDNEGPQTLYMRIYISAAPAGDVTVFESWYDGTNHITMEIRAGLKNRAYYTENPDSDQALAATAIASGAWATIGYTWDRTALDHSISYDGTNWTDFLNVTSGTWQAELDDITLGDNNDAGVSPGGADYIYIDRLVIIDGWKQDIPTNW